MVSKKVLTIGLLVLCFKNVIAFLSVPLSGADFSNLALTLSSHHQQFNESNPKLFNGDFCIRPCTLTDAPKICYYHMLLEHYAAMGSACHDCRWGNKSDCFHPQCITADGIERGVKAINRKIPGPTIHVCKNDIIVVDVENLMEGTSSTIHWHGFHQKISPFMDGVPFVTQCPIVHGTTFRYLFHANESGTQFYHAHAGHHKSDGHYGAMVVREHDDLNIENYDFDLPEHMIYLSDWMHDLAETFVPGIQSRTLQIDSLLINGRGRYFEEEVGEYTHAPFTFYRVKQNVRYRFRMVNSGSQVCPFQLQVEKHRMNVVATDGGSVIPELIDTLISTSGERYDFVINADQAIGNYWIRVRAIGACNINRKEQFAVLSYYDEDTVTDEELAFTMTERPHFDDTFPNGMSLNHPNSTCFLPGDDYVCVSDLQSHDDHRDDELIYGNPDHKFFIRFDTVTADPNILFSEAGYVRYMTIVGIINNIGVTNNISMVYQPFPLLTQSSGIDEDKIFCNASHRPSECVADNLCFCTHRIKVKYNSIVEMSLIDGAPNIRELYHPFHLHGHRFIVTGMGQLPSNKNINREEYVRQRNLDKTNDMPDGHNPPYKDTISIPSRGYTKIRFRAENPGFWLVHCHFEWHLGIGMSFVVQVGEIEQMVKPPPNFPTCGDFKMNVESFHEQNMQN